MKSKLYIIILLLIALFGVKALFHPGFYTSHDGRHQIIRLMHFHKGLVDGQLPVRWAGTALSGYGYPLFIFTYRLPFWIAEVWYLVSKNLGEAIKFVFIITFLVSGLAMYWFASKLWSSKLAGFLSAILYLWAPYRFVNIFVRASLGEAVSFVFIPLVFLGFFNLARQKKKQFPWIISTSLFLSGFLLSHVMTLALWLIPLGLWFGLNFYQSRKKKSYLLSSLLTTFLSLLLTSYYWLPAMLERKYIQVSGALGDYYKDHFVTLKQLIYSKWGYGISTAGTEKDMMSFQIGMSQWLVVFLSLFLIFLRLLVIKNQKIKRLYQNIINFKKNNFFLLIYFLVIYLLAISLMLPYSEGIYHFIKKFFNIDLPWRFLGISVFASSILFGGIILAIKNNLYKWGLISLILFLAFYGNRHHLRVNQYVYLPDFEYWQSTESSNEYNDYAPRWFLVDRFDQRDPQLLVFDGASSNKLVERKSNFFQFYSEVSSESTDVVVKVACYPGWQAFVDGEKITSACQDGRIKIGLNKGNHLVTLIFRETNLRNFCNWLSFSALVSLFLLFFKYVKSKK